MKRQSSDGVISFPPVINRHARFFFPGFMADLLKKPRAVSDVLFNGCAVDVKVVEFSAKAWHTCPYDRVKTMTAHSIMDILKNNDAVLKRHHVKRIGVFGSFARGEANTASDVDLLVEFDEIFFGNDCKGYYDTVTSLAGELHSLLNRDVDLVTRDMLSPHIAPAVLKQVRYLEGI